MLALSPHQLAALLPSSDEQIATLAWDFLQNERSEDVEDLPDESLEEMIWSGVLRCRPYALTSPVDRLAFVVARFDIAPNFDVHPAIHAILMDPEIPDGQRMDAVLRNTPATAWDEAVEHYDESAWFVDE